MTGIYIYKYEYDTIDALLKRINEHNDTEIDADKKAIGRALQFLRGEKLIGYTHVAYGDGIPGDKVPVLTIDGVLVLKTGTAKYVRQKKLRRVLLYSLLVFLIVAPIAFLSFLFIAS